MKKVLSLALMALTMGLVFVSCDKEKEDDVKSYTLSISLNKADSIYLGTGTENVYGYGYIEDDITFDTFILTHSHVDWGFGNSFGEGFTYTCCANDSTPGFMNLSAITGKGVKTNAYFIANAGGAAYEGGMAAAISFKDGKAYKVKDCYVTNSTYAYLAIKYQNDGNPEPMVGPWENNSKFTLSITGYNGNDKTASVDVALADGKNNILNIWQQVDLTKLGKVTKIVFSTTSTDPMTPSYFCLDQLTVTE
jgi:hypothetical protein